MFIKHFKKKLHTIVQAKAHPKLCLMSGTALCSLALFMATACDDGGAIEIDGPINIEDVIFEGVKVVFEPSGPGGSCDEAVTPAVDGVEECWTSQRLSTSDWNGNMCCGQAAAAMTLCLARQSVIGEADLREMIELAETLDPTWRNRENDTCDAGGTDSDLLADMLAAKDLSPETKTLGWCSLVDALDGHSIIIAHLDTQGGNSTNIFRAGKSHWVIIVQVKGNMTLVMDPGRSDEAAGLKWYTTESIRQRFEVRGRLAVIVPLRDIICPIQGPDEHYCSSGNLIVRTPCGQETTTDCACGCSAAGCLPCQAECPSGNGLYCGDESLGQDRNTLFLCVDGEYRISQSCTPGGECKRNPPNVDDECITTSCGDGLCNNTETTATCAQDCSATPVCGDGTCNGTETTATCAQDCPCAVNVTTTTQAIVGESTTFTATSNGCFDSQTVVWIGECGNLNVTSRTASQITWTCTTQVSGTQQVLVKKTSGGEVLYDGDVSFTCGAPEVTSVSPLQANAGVRTVFSVEGICLPSTAAVWVANCHDLEVIHREERLVQFACRGELGTREGVVKNAPGGTLLESFWVLFR
jgi:hypothetical protein